MIDHTGIKMSDPKKSVAFYEKALAPLGYKIVKEVPKEFTGGLVAIGMGIPPKPDFWLIEGRQKEKPLILFGLEKKKQADAF